MTDLTPEELEAARISILYDNICCSGLRVGGEMIVRHALAAERRAAIEDVLEFLHYHGHFHMEGVIRQHFLGDGDE